MRAASQRSAAAALATGLMGLALASAPDVEAKPVSVADLLAGSPAADWRVPSPEDTLYLELPRGRVVIELATRAAPQHAANIKALARAHYFDGLAIIRVQDNYVVQWDDESHRRTLPAERARRRSSSPPMWYAAARFEPLPDRDLYAPQVGFLDGFPAARDPRTHTVWLAHCYGMVGAGRDDPAESDGAEMYAVIGNAPRQLDRNVALVGRVLQGHGASLEPAARERRDGLLCRHRNPRSHPLGAHRRRRAASRAHADRGAAHQ